MLYDGKVLADEYRGNCRKVIHDCLKIHFKQYSSITFVRTYTVMSQESDRVHPNEEEWTWSHLDFRNGVISSMPQSYNDSRDGA